MDREERTKIIRQDNLSRGAFIIAILITIYLATYQTTTLILFPAILLISGFIMEYQLERKGTGFREADSPELKTDKAGIKKTGYYAIIGFAGLILTGYAISFTNYLNTLQITSYDTVLFSSLMAISEEMFFRGFILDFLLTSIKLSYLAIFMSAGVFTLYHFARYGSSVESLLYVFAGGFILSWITYKSRSLAPAIISHSLNNIISTLSVV